MFKNFFKTQFYINISKYRSNIKQYLLFKQPNTRKKSIKRFDNFLLKHFKEIIYLYILNMFVFYYIFCLTEINTFFFFFSFICVGVVYLFLIYIFTEKYK